MSIFYIFWSAFYVLGYQFYFLDFFVTSLPLLLFVEHPPNVHFIRFTCFVWDLIKPWPLCSPGCRCSSWGWVSPAELWAVGTTGLSPAPLRSHEYIQPGPVSSELATSLNLPVLFLSSSRRGTARDSGAVWARQLQPARCGSSVPCSRSSPACRGLSGACRAAQWSNRWASYSRTGSALPGGVLGHEPVSAETQGWWRCDWGPGCTAWSSDPEGAGAGSSETAWLMSPGPPGSLGTGQTRKRCDSQPALDDGVSECSLLDG